LANQTWHQATLALQLLADNPGLGGMVVRARSGPVRDAFMGLVAAFPGPIKRLHPNMSDDVLLSGLDLTATLATGSLVEKPGLLAGPGTLILTMGERCTAGMAARLALALDSDPNKRLIVLDEGENPDEVTPKSIAERLAFHVDLTDLSINDIVSIAHKTSCADTTADHLRQLTEISVQLGISSLRAPLFALKALRGTGDIETAATLTLVHRATQFPQEQSDSPAPEQQPERDKQQTQIPEDLVLEAIRALLPDDLLARIAAQKARIGKGNGSGAARKGNRRGRPLPARQGKLSDGARIDLIGTLRAAAPWQTIRRETTGRGGLHIRQSDIHVKRFEERSDRVLIFAVDASGSSAISRLGEAKGAIELLLSQAYARRDHVSLIAFRGRAAELLLPPTRSLVQTKRRLAALPGGGGTPLAAGLQEGLMQALQAKRKGLTPAIVILTDGRANIALDGSADRKQAAADAQAVAKTLKAQGIDGLVIDTGNRPEAGLKTLAAQFGAPYLALPRADAHRLSGAVSAALDA
jgi:magnesium chelatase subunit D